MEYEGSFHKRITINYGIEEMLINITIITEAKKKLKGTE